nr:MAG TPA: hypothetical protein [Caudoviricetes sp.]
MLVRRILNVDRQLINTMKSIMLEHMLQDYKVNKWVLEIY